ncbi:hypothetical protein AB0B79_05955 [Streptomyces sp. NPDC039022]|uniref:hypothetical protein n=1 Tax=unclassified Streptomyces TaxID=2593676 RepID=UPI0033E919B6
MPTPVHLDRLVGSEHAARFVNVRVRAFIRDDLLPEPVAYRLVCEGVLAHDPFVLADPGQVWVLRHEVTDSAAPLLIIIGRDGDQLTAEDTFGRRHRILLCALAAYQLDQWYWARDEESTS